MAYLSINNVRIAGFSTGVPKQVLSNEVVESEQYSASAFIDSTGVKNHRVSDKYTAGDLCYWAAEKLIADLEWNKNEIEAIIFVSQHADYILPATACILQDRLGLSKECYTADLSLGCSGWVYGLSTIMSLVSGGTIKKALLMSGDAKRRINYVDPLFGHAGAVTAVEYHEGATAMQFYFGTDGSGYDALIIPDGGARNQFSEKSFIPENIEGHMLNRLQSRMKGMDVFSFGITWGAKAIKRLAEHFGFDYQECDYFVFHQANLLMNEKIRTKLKLPKEKVPYCLQDFGNTASASIPLSIVSQLRGQVEKRKVSWIACGFGVGLSWGAVRFETENIIISELVEIE